MTCTGAVRSEAATLDDVIAEIAATRITERGETRADDRSERGRDGGSQAGGLLLWPSAGRLHAPQLLRFATAGSVDDGKSTLIGRLLYDSKSLMADQVADAELDLARLTDGLRAEREQGITIDVAYRHFSTPRRRFIIADTPGHAQYTRNMVTGASTADVAVVLVDAREGLLTQSRRHAAIAGLLRIPRIVLAVNKMDLVGYDADASAASAPTSAPGRGAWTSRRSPASRSPRWRATTSSTARARWTGTAGRRCSSSWRRAPVAAGPGGGAAAAAGPVRDPSRRAARLRGPARGRDA